MIRPDRIFGSNDIIIFAILVQTLKVVHRTVNFHDLCSREAGLVEQALDLRRVDEGLESSLRCVVVEDFEPGMRFCVGSSLISGSR